MKKKILIDSIIAVAVLIGISYTSVAGFQSVKFNSIEASPLFNIRTSRVINQEDDDLTCDYFRKGEESSLSIPKRDIRIEMIQKFVDIISKIDDKTSNWFLELSERKLITHDDTEMNIFEDDESLKYLRVNENLVKNYKINMRDITAYCGPTLGLGIFNCPYEFTIRYGGREFSGFGCSGFLSIFVFCIILVILIAIIVPPTTSILVCPQPVS